MRRVLLIGRHGCGKTSLVLFIRGDAQEPYKTQAAVYYPDFIDVPGEYLEVRSFYRALIMLSSEACAIALLQAADDGESLYPGGLARVFDKPVIGVVTKLDVTQAGAGSVGEYRGGTEPTRTGEFRGGSETAGVSKFGNGAETARTGALRVGRQAERAGEILREAGATRLFYTSALTGAGIGELRRCLDELRAAT